MDKRARQDIDLFPFPTSTGCSTDLSKKKYNRRMLTYLNEANDAQWDTTISLGAFVVQPAFNCNSIKYTRYSVARLLLVHLLSFYSKIGTLQKYFVLSYCTVLYCTIQVCTRTQLYYTSLYNNIQYSILNTEYVLYDLTTREEKRREEKGEENYVSLTTIGSWA